MSTDYGVLDPGAARRWGYGWDPATSSASQPKGRRMTGAEYADFPVCSAEANRRMMLGVDVKGNWLYAGTRASEVDEEAKRDPRLREAFAVWSRCMAERGFAGYPDPLSAYADPAWQRAGNGNTLHTRHERATAVADVTCKHRHHTAEIWHKVRAQNQTTDIERHHDRYASGLQALRTYRANVAAVLRQFG
ncbi:hypothetical protein [Streptomyces sp. YS-3]|uniref:hypothetical protein n=1 Tax=Streptomyces sp. YS-3 TaxID=3381352 RepID=UPI0038622802